VRGQIHGQCGGGCPYHMPSQLSDVVQHRPRQHRMLRVRQDDCQTRKRSERASRSLACLVMANSRLQTNPPVTVEDADSSRDRVQAIKRHKAGVQMNETRAWWTRLAITTGQVFPVDLTQQLTQGHRLKNRSPHHEVPWSRSLEPLGLHDWHPQCERQQIPASRLADTRPG
jgi:hypothetical protein